MESIVNIEMDITDVNSQEIKLNYKWKPTSTAQYFALPIWTPGSYKVRDHSQYLYDLKLKQNNKIINTTRLETSKWSFIVDSLDEVELSYKIIANQLTVRTSYLDPDFASLCLASVLILPIDHRYSKFYFSIKVPENWLIHTPLSKIKDYYQANDYDTLIDSPIIAGDLEMSPLVVNKCKHSLICIGEPPKGWNMNLLNDIESICNASCQIMDEKPPSGDKYMFFIHMLENAYGGLEHDYASVIQYDWRRLNKKSGYRKFLQLIGHEYLHQWNVRRLRPVEYIKYNYNKAVISDSLWFSEGITSYFDIALPLISKISLVQELYDDFSDELSKALNTPGKSFHNLADSSRETWVKLYNSTPSSVDTQISYYRFGTILSLCLDIQLRKFNSSLSKILRQMWALYGKNKKGFSRKDILNLIMVVNEKLANDLNLWLDIPDNLPIFSSLEMIGLELEQSTENKIQYGFDLSIKNNIISVIRVEKNSPASQAGIVINDEILAIDKYKINDLEDLKNLAKSKEACQITFFRNGTMRTTTLTPDMNREKKWQLKISNESNHQATTLRSKWLEFI